MTLNPWLWGPAATLAAVLVILGRRSGATRAGAWAATSVIAQAAMLAQVKAGPLVGYQHYAGLGEAWRERRLALLLSLIVAGAAVAGFVARQRAVVAWLSGRRRPWTLVAALMVGSVLAAAPSAAPGAYASELAMAVVLQLAALACTAFAVMALPDEHVARVNDVLARHLEPGAGPPRLDRFAWIAAGFVTVAAAILCLTSYQAIPHIPDEIAYLIQARYFALGLPWMSPPPVPAAFDTFLLEVSGDRWYGVFPPGWPLVLAAGVKLGVPWLVNPVLGGVSVLLAYLLIQELSDRGTARMSAVLLAVSPWHLLMSMNFMSHALSLVLALVTALGAARAFRTGSWRPAAVAGLSLGILGMSRPLEGVAMGLLAGVPLLVAAVRRARPGTVLAAGAGALLTGIPGLAYNKVITGSPWLFPAERLFDREYGPGRYGFGFGPGKGVGWTGLDPFPGHGPVDVVVNTVLNGFMVNIDLLGWSVGSVAIVMLGLLNAGKGIDRLMAGAILVVVAFHSAYWFSGGPDFGARYWYLIIVPCVLLASRALRSLDGHGPHAPRGRAVAAAVLLSVSAMAVYVPWRASDKYRHYRSVRPDLVAMRNDERYRNALVLVSGRRHPDWATAAYANEIPLGGSAAPVFAWDLDAETRRALLAAYPTRTVWLVRGPTETGRGFEIVRGPIAPGERTSLLPP